MKSAPTEAAHARTTLTPGRRCLYEQIATLTAGNANGDVFAALADNWWQAAAFLCETPEAAEKLMRDTIPDLVRDMRANWHEVAAVKSQAMAGATFGNG